MHTKTKTILAFGLFALTTLASAASFGAPVTEFEGSRADVRAFCESEGAFLMDAGTFTLCVTPTTDVVCRDDGECSSSDIEVALAAGFQRTDVTVFAGQTL
jgi:hypothetical protein